jgi:hypothetical protein
MVSKLGTSRTFFSATVLFVLASGESAAAVQLPSDSDVNGIVKLCAVGRVQQLQGDVEGKILLWKRQAEAEGKASLSDLGAILSTVSTGQQISPDVYKVYTDCIKDSISQFLSKHSSLVPKSPILVSDNYDSSKLKFDLIISNPGEISTVLTGVGVRTRGTLGAFQCASASLALTPLADYIVRFHVRDSETIVQADPPVEIASGSSGRVSISMMPSALGACGFWKTEASAVLRFSDNSELETGPQQLTTRELSKLSDLTLSDHDLLIALRHRDPSLRMEAVRRLNSSHLDGADKKNILDSKLDDSDYTVRVATVDTIGKLKYYSFGDKLVK